MQPVPLGPLTVVGGITFAVLGWQLWGGHESFALPKRFRALVLSEKTWLILAAVCLRVVTFCKKFTKPRFNSVVAGESGRKIGAFILVSAGLLMAIPFGVLPFNNMLPGLAILFYCLGQLEQDGLMIFIAFFWLVFTVIYFGLFFFGIYYLSTAALVHLGVGV